MLLKSICHKNCTEETKTENFNDFNMCKHDHCTHRLDDHELVNIDVVEDTEEKVQNNEV